MHIRATPHKPIGLRPFELIYGRTFITHQVPYWFPTKSALTNHFLYLILIHKLLWEYTDWCLPCPGLNSSVDPDTSPLQLGDLVLLKNLHQDLLHLWWTKHHTVILTTPTVAKLGHTTWHHLSHLKLFQVSTLSQWEVQPIRPTTLTFQPQIVSPIPCPSLLGWEEIQAVSSGSHHP